MEYLRARLLEQSTWKGIAQIVGLIGGLFGYQVSPELGGAIAGAGFAVAGLINILMPEKK